MNASVDVLLAVVQLSLKSVVGTAAQSDLLHAVLPATSEGREVVKLHISRLAAVAIRSDRAALQAVAISSSAYRLPSGGCC